MPLFRLLTSPACVAFDKSGWRTVVRQNLTLIGSRRAIHANEPKSA
jgi:hypothetical protein